MHKSSYNLMAYFVKKYVSKKSLVLDVGGSNVNGSYKKIIKKHKSKYQTLDWDKADYIVRGYDWSVVPEDHFDVVISGQTFEHDSYFWKSLENIKAVVKKEGIVIIIVPSSGGFHQYPVDCYRFYPDSALVFAEILNANVLEVMWNNKFAAAAINDPTSIDIRSIIFNHQFDTATGDLGMVFKIKSN
jgi:SAM-dependent methyltransferase